MGATRWRFLAIDDPTPRAFMDTIRISGRLEQDVAIILGPDWQPLGNVQVVFHMEDVANRSDRRDIPGSTDSRGDAVLLWVPDYPGGTIVDVQLVFEGIFLGADGSTSQNLRVLVRDRDDLPSGQSLFVQLLQSLPFGIALRLYRLFRPLGEPGS